MCWNISPAGKYETLQTTADLSIIDSLTTEIICFDSFKQIYRNDSHFIKAYYH